MQSGLIITRGAGGLAMSRPAPLPIALMLQGRPVAEALDLLPRIFNLCRAAQAMALRLALGLGAGDTTALRAEIRREHLAKLWLIWPGLLGLPPQPLRADAWADVWADVWGGAVPDDLAGWLGAGRGAGPLLAAIARAFAPGEACARLPLVTPQSAFSAGPQENSVAARQAAHPLMRQAEHRFGRGPLWQALARVIEADALAKGDLPAITVLPCGTAIVPAARGAYAIRAEACEGMLTRFERRTPTDHLCAPGGGLEQALTALPLEKHPLAPLVVDILSPCVPVAFREVADA